MIVEHLHQNKFSACSDSIHHCSFFLEKKTMIWGRDFGVCFFDITSVEFWRRQKFCSGEKGGPRVVSLFISIS